MASSEVKLTANSSASKSPKLCGICDVNPSKYCCPRCGVFYCCLDCYRSEKHQECSENFYKDCITEELAGDNIDDESKQKMMEILKRAHSDDVDRPEHFEELIRNIDELDEDADDSDDEDYVDLEERVKELNLDDPNAVWEILTEDERNEFEALMSQGDVATFMERWEPWWGYCREERKVQDLDDEEEVRAEKEALAKCPNHLQTTQISALTTVEPSPAIKFNITNVISSYAFVVRYFNGELEPVEVATYLLEVCANLDKSTNFEDPAIAVESVVQHCLQSKLIETDEPSLDVMKHDTVVILTGPSKQNKTHYCLSALSHLHQIFSEAKIVAKSSPKSSQGGSGDKKSFSHKFPEHKSDHLPALDISKFKKCMKKLEYYLSFVKAYGMEF